MDRALNLGRLKALYRAFGPFLRPYRGRIALAYGALAASVLMTLARPWPLKLILDSVLLRKQPLSEALPLIPETMDLWSPHLLIAILSIALVAAVIIESIFGYYQKLLFSSAGQSATTDVLEHVFTHLQTLPNSDAGRRSGDTIVRLTSDVKTVRDLLVNHLQKFATYGFTVASTAAVMAWMNWKLTLIGLVVVPLIWIASYRFARHIRSAAKRKRRKEGDVASIVQETLHSIPVVQAFTQEDAERDRFRREARESLDAGIESARLGGAFSRSVRVLNTVGTAAVVWYGATRVLNGTLTPGDLVVFAAYVNELYSPIQNLSELALQFMESLVAGERVLDLLETTPKIRDHPHAVRAPSFQGNVAFENVSFEFQPGRPVLDHISFSVRRGEMVALVGPSGSGKSTILNLLLRFLDPVEGRVTIDGDDIRWFTLRSLRSQISVVLQESILFRRSIQENIAYGRPDATLAQVIAAAKAARAHDFIEALPEGYTTMLDERGGNLSGGQRQRIAVARAFLRNAPILLLDEPTTGLDAGTEAELAESILELARGRTTLVVAHRLTTIEHADRILVLEGGRIVEEGKHQDLIARGTRYLGLYHAQVQ